MVDRQVAGANTSRAAVVNARTLEVLEDLDVARTLITISQDADGVTAEFDDGDVIRARYAVGADGIRSTVREHAGIGFQGGVYDESFALADVRLAGDVPVES